jgi:hypothetical protein
MRHVRVFEPRAVKIAVPERECGLVDGLRCRRWPIRLCAPDPA